MRPSLSADADPSRDEGARTLILGVDVGSTTTPFTRSWPSLPDAAIYLQDVMATAIDLAEAEKPKHVFYDSLRPLLSGEQKQSSYESVYVAYNELQRSVTRDGWKLITYPKAKVLRLYHLADDPQEMHDLAANPDQAAMKKSLFERLVKHSAEMGDKVDLRSAFNEQ